MSAAPPPLTPLSPSTTATPGLDAAFHRLLSQFPGAVLILSSPDYTVEFVNEAALAISGKSRVQVYRRSIFDGMPLAEGQGFRTLLDSVRTSGLPVTLTEHKTLIERNGHVETAWLNFSFQPVTTADETVEKILVMVTDESERVMASTRKEESRSILRRTRNELELSISIGRIGIWHWDVKNDVVTWSKEQLALYGLKEAEFGGRIADFHKLVLPEDLIIIKSTASLEKYEENDIEYRFRIRRSDGQIRWMQGRSRSFFSESGELQYRTGVNIDITEEKLSWERMQESEERFRSTFHSAAVGIAHVSIQGGWLLVNETLCNLLGYTRDELLQLTFQDISHPDDLQADLELVQQVLEGTRDSYVLEKRYIHKSGAVIWANLSVSLVRSAGGNPKYFISVVEDISERKKAEERIRESEERQSLVIEAANIGLWDYDIRQDVTTLSERSRDFYSLGADETFTFDRFLSVVHADDRHRVAQAIHQLLYDADSSPSYRDEYRVIRKDGEARWMRATGRVLVNGRGERYRFIGAMHDITEEKRSADALQQLVTERTKDLQTANAELQRSNEDLQQFAHVASHDLKEPIRKIRTFGSRLDQEFGHLLPGNGRFYLQKVLDSAERMFGLIEGVLNYSTYSAMETLVDTVDLNETFANIESDLEVLLAETGASVHRTELPVVSGSSVLLNQLFYNLLNNAVKFSKPQVSPAVRVTCRLVTGAEINQVDAADLAKRFYCVEIIDNGIGIRQEHAEKIFKSFTRLNSRDKYEGTGLGLALCRKIAERHSGYIYATGKEGDGSCFSVLLPV